MDSETFANAAAELGLALSSAQLKAFADFESALYRANEVMNLTRVAQEECGLRHFLDSLLLAAFIPEGATVLDIGTGPGFPAWPLACARPDLAVTAVDSSGKMLGFLRRQVLPNLRIIETRVEDWDVRDAFVVVTGRAVAPFPVQMEISAPVTAPQGIVLPMRTPNDRDAWVNFPADTLGLTLETVHEVPLPGTDIVRCLPQFRKIGVTPRTYPRNWADIKRKPLGSETEGSPAEVVHENK